MSFTWFDKFTDAMAVLPEDEAKELSYAVFAYGSFGEDTDLSTPALRGMFLLMKEDIDNSISHRNNGSKGGRPKATPDEKPEVSKSKKPVVSEDGKPGVLESKKPGVSEDKKPEVSENQKPKPDQTNTDQTNTNQARPKRFRPPTREELQGYVNEKDLTVNVDQFFDFYESKGWKVGRSPMKDWKAAARGWSRRERGESRALSAEAKEYADLF